MRERRRRGIDDKISINERSNSAYLSHGNAVRCSAPLRSSKKEAISFPVRVDGHIGTHKGIWTESIIRIKYFLCLLTEKYMAVE